MKTRGTSYAFDGDEPIYEHDDYYRVYGYDLQNRLVKVSGYIDGVLTVLATYGYGGDNLRLTKTAGSVTTRYVHGVDGNELYRGTASASVSTVWLFGRKLVEIEVAAGSEKRTYLHTDHLGSVVAATDETGATIWFGDNSAFGVATADVGLAPRTTSYTGKDYDEAAGLYYFNARWYDAELGRFTTEDPARDDVNWYVYCANRPMTNVDQTGTISQQAREMLIDGTDIHLDSRDTRVRQKDSEIEPSGNLACLYRSLQASTEEKTGRNLTVDQINEATEALLESGVIGPSEYYPEADTYFVNDPVAVIQDALSRLGVSDAFVAVVRPDLNSPGEKARYAMLDADYTIRVVQGHFQLGDAEGNLIWDPNYGKYDPKSREPISLRKIVIEIEEE